MTFLENMVCGIPRLMQVYKGVSELKKAPKNAVVTIGNFDGVHLGHQEILQRVRARALEIDGTSVAVTFNPHPYFVIRDLQEPYLINTYEERIWLLQKNGIELVIEQPFNRAFSNTDPEHFVEEFLKTALQTKVLFLGYDFSFGKERSGSVQVMERLAHARGIEIHVVPPLRISHSVVSSSLIRRALGEGDLGMVNQCLGRPFFLRGLVWRGEGRGRKIGVPTANLQTDHRLYPKVGVYASRTIWRQQTFQSISNIGFNPTFKGDGSDLPLKIETHLFDFNEDIYGDEIQVDFHEFLRPEQKFLGVDSLLKQINLDKNRAREILGRLSC